MDQNVTKDAIAPPKRKCEATALCLAGLYAASVALLVALARWLDVDLIDDSYIFLVYARNLAEGHGPVFNIGERVEGFSSPLWTFVLGGMGALTSNLERVAYGLGLLCGAAVLVLLIRHAARQGGMALIDLAVLGLGLAAAPAIVFWSASGMDAMLFTLLVTAVLLSTLDDRRGERLSARSAVLLILATLARPEGVLLAAFAAAFWVYERRSVRMLIGYALFVAAMLLARYGYYGEWVPNTYHAKVTFTLSRRLHDGWAYLAPAMIANAGLLIVTCAVAVAAWRRSSADRRVILYLAAWVVAWAGYVTYVGGDNFAMFRFLLPAFPAIFLLLIRSWSLAVTPLRPASRRACLAALALAFTASHGLTLRSQAKSYRGDVILARAWSDVGRWIERETPKDAVIATVVPGAIGYFAHRTTIDMLGLTDREVCLRGDIYPEGGHGHARYNTDYIYSRAPNLVLYHSSGRFTRPVYADPKSIHRLSGYALYDFVVDPRCKQRYEYATATLDNGMIVEMQRKRGADATSIASTTP